MRRICYIHGFNSGPESVKAQLVKDYFQGKTEVMLPRLALAPELAIAQLLALCGGDGNELVLIGSSLGGFYALYLAEYYQCPAVLVNPLINPKKYQQGMVGTHINPYNSKKIIVTEKEVIQSFDYIYPEVKESKRYLVLLTKDDEVLDYRDALALFASESCYVSVAGGHAFTDFADWLPKIEQHLQLWD
ncbi:esterase YqiA [Piscirickettsia salmonis]|uniref:Esterase YqiA n=1 Tax=Piscirickettsia salmonis TaxID=1238 RepID=A0A9Q6LK57_PISSA|nr:YqiA/YcfP family alpha/beta fold hydrolase [Piscirickettsia salmonis]QGN95718.1 esterase YqiA [Piscirickettsia salmonis]QGO05331.1 esterase YqiA [Piscirickettsia salmonis]QGO33652.1 esterase YqiA [Piscirickettsia salmonis]QGO37264.1 esterase YqiA [Piscirickettsia salmonis]QGO40888.1 esterase YqiA [Piscirickettsia salmonis]